jgi:hypothetical protein
MSILIPKSPLSSSSESSTNGKSALKRRAADVIDQKKLNNSRMDTIFFMGTMYDKYGVIC